MGTRGMATSPENPNGVLAIDKPVGPTSHDVVAVARRALRTRRIGHTGTLDPFASGLLLLCVGSATRIAEYLAGQAKTYQAVMRLGAATDTDDGTGTVVARSDDWRDLDAARVAAALTAQHGRRLQRPPAYSAKKVDGERLYARARRGETVIATPVEVEILAIALTGWEPPDASFEVTCSSGTYVRAIARDAGDELGCFAHLVALRRTAIGSTRVEAAISLATLEAGGLDRPLLPALAALEGMPAVHVDDRAAADLRHGRAVAAPTGVSDGPVAVAWAGELLAIAEAGHGRLQPRKVLLHA